MITFVGIDFKVQLSAEAMLMGRLDQSSRGHSSGKGKCGGDWAGEMAARSIMSFITTTTTVAFAPVQRASQPHL